MSRRAALLLSVALLAPGSALALDPTAPATTDNRIRVVDYDPEQVVLAYARPGQTFRIRLAPDERVVPGGIAFSDQGTISPPEDDGDDEDAAKREREQRGQSGSGAQGAVSCDRNMCRSIVMNSVFIMARVSLEPQSLFLRTEWCPEPGKACLPGEYAIELHTDAAKAKAAGIDTAIFGIQYRYAAREATHRAKVAQALAAERAEKARLFRRDNPPPEPPEPPSVPQQDARWDLGRCSSGQEIAPDDAWTDGRTTFLAYNGPRRIPNVYEVSAEGKETLTQYAAEPEPARTILRVAKVRSILILRDGDRASCVVFAGADTSNRAELAVAPIAQPIAGQPRTRRRYP